MFSANVEEVEAYLVAKLPELHVPPKKESGHILTSR
jgi:hypothetical protein